MRLRSRTDQNDRCDVRGVRRLHLERGAIRERGGAQAADRRPHRGAAVRIEQVRWGIDLDVRLISAACWVSTNQHHRGIRKKQGAGVIEAWVSVHSRGTETVRVRIVQVGIPACGCCILIVRRSAGCQDSAVRQDRRIHFDAGLRHRRSVLPLHRRRAEIDDFRRSAGGSASSEVHDPRSVVGG